MVALKMAAVGQSTCLGACYEQLLTQLVAIYIMMYNLSKMELLYDGYVPNKVALWPKIGSRINKKNV